MTGKSYGKTADGRPIDESVIERLAGEAERGFTPAQVVGKPRGRGRPPLGDQRKSVGSIRLDAELREQAATRAAADGVTVSEVVRRALRAYLKSAS